eukprot:9840277-Lingulodinium_polyedra.AAC.1
MAWTEKSHSSVRTSAAKMEAMQWRSAGVLARHGGWAAAHLAKLSASSFQGCPTWPLQCTTWEVGRSWRR